MVILTQAINGTYTPWFYQNIDKQNYAGIRKITQITASIMAVSVIILMFFAPEIVTIIGGDKYREAVYVIPPVAASVFFIFMYNIFANVEFYFEKNKYVMVGSIIAAILNLLLNFIFIRIFGYLAAAYTTLFCYMIYCFTHQLLATKVCSQNNIPKSIFNAKWISFLYLFVVCVSFGMNFIYMNNVIRYIFIITVVLVLLIKRRAIVILIKDLFKIIKKKDI